MNAVVRSVLLAVCLVASLAIRADAQISTSEVHGIKLSATGSFQFSTNPPAIGSFKITEDTVINLARGRASTAVVPDNEALALLLPDDDGSVDIVVFDTGTSNVLATVAETDESGELLGAKGGVIILSMDVQEVGTGANGLDDGNLFISGAFSETPAGALSKFKATFFGLVEANINSNSVPLLLEKGKIGTTGRIGTIVSGPI